MAKKKEAKPVQNQPNIPPELKKKLDEIKVKIDKFQKITLEKFDKYIMGIGLLPPPKNPKEGEEKKVELVVLVDDSDSTRMSKAELKDKLTSILAKTAKDIDENLIVETVILSELWQSCYDAKYDLLQLVAMAAPVFDRGMMAAVKIAEVHKNMVLKKFEKYIVSYVLAGSLVQGRATPQSDIDVFIVIDDTDVKKMTRFELKDKLRAIISGMGLDAGHMTGIKNKLNMQVYILTDFWDNIKEANPVIFTFLRDGIPFYDRGIFMAWKQLLKLGKVKPSPEAIDMYMHSGEQSLGRVKGRLRDLATEDFFWSILTPSQAALMLYGYPPPTPKETPGVLREVFVKKAKIMDESMVKVLEHVIKVRKDIEHGTKKVVTGKEIDELYTSCEKYLKDLKKLFTQIEQVKDKESVNELFENSLSMLRDALALEGIDHVTDKDAASLAKQHLIEKGKVGSKVERQLKTIIKAKDQYDAGKLSHTEISKIRKESKEVTRELLDFIQKKRGKELARARVRVKHGKQFGDVYVLDKEVFIIKDIDAKEREITKATLGDDGSLKKKTKGTEEELEHALAHARIPPHVFIKQTLLESVKQIFGADAEILLHR